MLVMIATLYLLGKCLAEQNLIMASPLIHSVHSIEARGESSLFRLHLPFCVQSSKSSFLTRPRFCTQPLYSHNNSNM